MASEAAEVGASLKSVLELFILEGKFIGVLVAGDLDQVPGLTTCERGLIGHTAKPSTATGIDAKGYSIPSPISLEKKKRTKLKQAQEVATRHETEE